MNILLIDNYDSFTYNLVHLLKVVGVSNVTVKRNNEVEIPDCSTFDKILFSPGPGLPSEAGNMPKIMNHYLGKKPILGVCLGHQALGEVCGGTLKNLGEVVHGKATNNIVLDKEDCIYKGLPEKFLVGRYHSWVMDKDQVPSCLTVTATDEKGEIMSVRHNSAKAWGVQFHPESILTEFGREMLAGWVRD